MLAPGFSPLSALVPLVLRERRTERLKVLVPSYCGSPAVSLHFQFILDIFPIHAWVCKKHSPLGPIFCIGSDSDDGASGSL